MFARWTVGRPPSCTPAPESSGVGIGTEEIMYTQSPAEKRRINLNPVHAYSSDVGPPRAARDVPAGERWAFQDHRSMAEILAQEPF